MSHRGSIVLIVVGILGLALALAGWGLQINTQPSDYAFFGLVAVLAVVAFVLLVRAVRPHNNK